MDLKSFLFVKRQPASDEALKPLIQQLFQLHGLDSYRIRVALMGNGLGLIKRDEFDQLTPIADTLESFGYEWFISDTVRPKIKPVEIQAFTVHKDRIVFDSHHGSVTMQKGDRILAVLAGVEGNMLSKLVRKSHHHKNGVATMSEGEKYTAIIHSHPVLDLYILHRELKGQSPSGGGPLRFRPGKFDISGLGKYATQSVNQNIDRMFRLVKHYAGQLHLELDFGLFQIPGCMFKNDRDEKNLDNNLERLTRYGYQLLNLYYQKHNRPRRNQASRTVASISNPAVAIPGAAAASAHLISGASQDEDGAATSSASTKAVTPLERPIEELLPAPPEPRKRTWLDIKWSDIFFAFLFLSFYCGGGAIAMFGEGNAQQLVLRYGLQSGLAAFVIAAALFYGAFHYLRVKRFMDNTPTSKARSVAMGMVEMKGTCRRAYNLVSPITQLPCIYYRIQKFRKKLTKNGYRWHRISDVESARLPFYLKDDTGQVVVDPVGANMKASHKETIDAGMGTMFGVPGFPDADTKYVEEIIAEFTEAYVLGFAVPNKVEQDSVSSRATEKLRKLKGDQLKMMEYDTNRDGRIDDEEWEHARSEMEYEALKDTLKFKEKAKPQGESVLIQKPKFRGLPFIIAGSSEGAITTIYKYLSAAMFAGALAGTVTGMMLLLGMIEVNL